MAKAKTLYYVPLNLYIEAEDENDALGYADNIAGMIEEDYNSIPKIEVQVGEVEEAKN